MATDRTNVAKLEMFKVERTTATSCDAFGGQRTFFYLHREDPNHPSWWLLTALLLEGPLDHRALESSLHELVRRHTVYRTGLEEVAWGELRQHVRPPDPARDVQFQITDLSSLAAAEQATARDAIFEQLRAGGHDLATGAGLRCHVIVLAPDRHVLAIAVHHVACDGAGLTLLQEDLGRLYAGAAKEERPLCFIDFAESIARWTESAGGQAERAYWRNRLAGAPPVELPVDHPEARAAIDARRDATPFGLAGQPMARLVARFSEAAHAGVTRMATSAGTTPNVVYLAALAYMLHGLTGQTDVCIDSTQSHRLGRPVLERVHGSLASPRVMRMDVSGDPTWQELVGRTKQLVGDAYRRSWVPMLDLAHHSIRRVLFNYLPYASDGEFEFAPDLQARWLAPKTSDAWRRHWDLQFLLLEQSRAVLLFYSMPLFENATAQMMLDRYVSLIHSAAS